MEQSKEINFDGQNIYIGIDVHLKTWSVTIITQSSYKRKHSQKSSSKELFEHLKKHYPNGNYQAVYESGFSGFSTYYALQECKLETLLEMSIIKKYPVEVSMLREEMVTNYPYWAIRELLMNSLLCKHLHKIAFTNPSKMARSE